MTRNEPTRVQSPGSNLPPGTPPHITQRVAELTGMVTPDPVTEGARDAGGLDEEPPLQDALDRSAADVAAMDATGQATLNAPIDDEGPTWPGDTSGADFIRDGDPDEHVAAEERRVARETGTDYERADDGAMTRRAVRSGPGSPLRAPVPMPSTDTTPAEFARRLEALKEAEDTIGSASGTFGSPVVGGGSYVSRPITEIVYVAEWLLDTSTPVHLPGREAGDE